MAITLEHDGVLIGEGIADYRLYEALIEKRDLAKFDMPFWKRDPMWSVSKYGKMLSEIVASMKLVSEYKGQINRVVLVLDACDDPARSFKDIAEVIENTGSFAAPSEPGRLGDRRDGFPPVMVVLVPHDRRGGLETLCRDYLGLTDPEIRRCVDEFFACRGGLLPSWTTEKRDKAWVAAWQAVSNHDDPTKSLQHAFGGDNPLIDVKHEIFDHLARLLSTDSSSG
jgi:hypothetical protein